MSSETITTAIFLITAVVATAVLVNAIYPVIYSTAGTFQTATHDSEMRLRTDFKIVAAFNTTAGYDIYMKNVGSQRISLDEIKAGDVFCGKTVGKRLEYTSGWTAEILPASAATDGFWDNGETLVIRAARDSEPGATIYFQFVLPTGTWRSIEFT